MSTSPPSEWPEREHEFHEAYRRDPYQWPRTRVRWQVMGGMPGAVWPGPAWLPVGWLIGWIASRVLRRKPVNLDAFMAVFPIEDPADELIFEFEPVPAVESGEGVVVGEYAANGAMVLETDDCGLIWPTYNPRRPVTPDRPN